MNSKLIEGAVEKHNELRALHKITPLVHNPDLSNLAQKWAETLAQKDKLDHSIWKFNQKRVGENCAMCYGGYFGTNDFEIGKNGLKMFFLNLIQIKN